MDAVSFKLDVFEGPLDLLLHLIKKNKVSIYDIPISLITDQYLEYIDNMKKNELEVSSEFIVMASRLMYIKSKMLLPVYDEEEAEEDPRQELILNLAEYKKYKDISAFFENRKNICDYLYFKEPDTKLLDIKPLTKETDAEKLITAFNNIMIRKEKKMPPPRSSFDGIVGKEPVPVKSKIKSVSNKIRKRGKVEFEELFDDAESRSEIVAIFLAVLELLRNHMIWLSVNNSKIVLGETDG